MGKLIEKNTCASCGEVSYRDSEIINSATSSSRSRSSFSAVIVKNHTCVCGEKNNFQVEIINEKDVEKAI